MTRPTIESWLMEMDERFPQRPSPIADLVGERG
jgi:hypothetical protein